MIRRQRKTAKVLLLSIFTALTITGCVNGFGLGRALASKSPVGFYTDSGSENWHGNLIGTITVTDKGGKAAGGAEVQIYYKDTLVASANCSADGKLTVDSLKKGTTYRITAKKNPCGEMTREHTVKEDGEQIRIRLPGGSGENKRFSRNYLLLLFAILSLLLAVFMAVDAVLKKKKRKNIQKERL